MPWIEGPGQDEQGNRGDAVWADEGGVLLRVIRSGNNAARFEIIDSTGEVHAKATVSSFRWQRIMNQLAPFLTEEAHRG